MEMSGKDELSELSAETKDKLDARVRIWKRVLFGVAACLVGGYLVYFGLILGQNPATDADKWGTFGDFVGGLLNPIVAFAAFFWLTESVKLQKQELAATRAELKVAAEAQQQLVENARVTVQISALTALLQDVSNEYQHSWEISESIWKNRPSDDERHKQMDYDTSHVDTLQAINIRIKQANADRKQYLSELKQLIADQKPQAPV